MRITCLSSTCLLAVLACSAAWSAEPPTPAQEQELHEALSEGISGKDFKLVELSLKGFAAGAIQGNGLEKHIAQARIDAAMAMLQPSQAGSIEAWTLAAQAKAGDTAALESLRTAARTAFDPAKKNADKDDARAIQVEQQKGLAALECLAYLKDASVPAIIRSRMAQAPAEPPNYKLHQQDPDAYAVALAAFNASRMIPIQVCNAQKALDGDAWPAKIQALVADKTLPLANRVNLLAHASGMIRMEDRDTADAAKAFEALSLNLIDEVDEQTPNHTIQQMLGNCYRIADRDQKLAYLKRIDEKVTDANMKKQVAAYIKSVSAMRGHKANPGSQPNQGRTPVAPPKENGGEF